MADAPPSQPTLLSLPGDALELIVAKLDSGMDRLHWECTCRTLLAASRGEGSAGTWWGLPSLTLYLESARGTHRAGVFLAARRPTAATLRLIAYEADWDEFTAWVPPTTAPILPSPPRERGDGGRVAGWRWQGVMMCMLWCCHTSGSSLLLARFTHKLTSAFWPNAQWRA